MSLSSETDEGSKPDRKCRRISRKPKQGDPVKKGGRTWGVTKAGGKVDLVADEEKGALIICPPTHRTGIPENPKAPCGSKISKS